MLRKIKWVLLCSINVLRNLMMDKLYYFNRYDTYEQAEKAAREYGDAYQAENIINSVAEATQKVRRGEAVYEEDGVAFYKENNNHELLSSMMYVAALRGSLNVIDFGGALGSMYFRYRKYLDSINARWEVVEQEHFVEYGKKNVPEVTFNYKISDCNIMEADLVLLSSVLGYFDDPYKYFHEILEQNVPFVIIDKTAFSADDTHVITLQHVPASIYKATYPVQLLSETQLLSFAQQHGYEVVWAWDYRFGSIPMKDGLKYTKTLEKGFLLRQIN